MEIIWSIIAVLLLILGLIGCIAPVLPGVILAYGALFCLIPTQECPSIMTFVLFGLMTIAVTVADSIIPAIGAKKFNSTKLGVWGCVIGTVVGFLFLPAGLIMGPFLGAFVGELIAGKKTDDALYSGLGSLLGFLAGTALKIAVCIALAVVIISRVI